MLICKSLDSNPARYDRSGSEIVEFGPTQFSQRFEYVDLALTLQKIMERSDARSKAVVLSSLWSLWYMQCSLPLQSAANKASLHNTVPVTVLNKHRKMQRCPMTSSSCNYSHQLINPSVIARSSCKPSPIQARPAKLQRLLNNRTEGANVSFTTQTPCCSQLLSTVSDLVRNAPKLCI